MSEDTTYEKDVSIDPNSLDLEWINQPKVYMKWAKLASMADKKVKDLKEKLDFTDAKIDKQFREDMNGTKFTEAMVKAYVTEHTDHQKAIEAFNNAVYQYNMCSNAVRALDHKKVSLENLVKLWGGAYFSGPKEPRDLNKIMDMQKGWKDKVENKKEEIIQENRAEVSERISRRRRNRE